MRLRESQFQITLMGVLLVGILILATFSVQAHDSLSPHTRTELKKLQADSPRVLTGAEVLLSDHLGDLKGKRIGLVMNKTSRVGGDGGVDVFLVDSLIALGIDVRVLFAPEHGIRGEAEAGEKVASGVDGPTGLSIYSLYGTNKKPSVELLQTLDLVLFDLQDVGARFYTYLSTLGLVLEAAGEADIPVWVLDRPNPAGGEYVKGWILELEHQSFVGWIPVPIAHGMTLGELGQMMLAKGWVPGRGEAQEGEFRVIAMKGWERGKRWKDTGLTWLPPSPNLPTPEHAYVYLGTCLIEGTTMSEGRGTEDPFLLIGSPTTKRSTTSQDFPVAEGALLQSVSFTPRSITGKSLNPKFKDTLVDGIRVTVTDYDLFDPVETGLVLLKWLLDNSPEQKTNTFLYRLAGTREIDEYLFENRSLEDLAIDAQEFKKDRAPFLLY